MTTRKRNNLMAAYTGFRGTRTLDAVLTQIPESLIATMTGKQLGHVASLLYAAYNSGRASTGASIEDDCVWVAPLGRLIPLADLTTIGVSQ